MGVSAAPCDFLSHTLHLLVLLGPLYGIGGVTQAEMLRRAPGRLGAVSLVQCPMKLKGIFPLASIGIESGSVQAKCCGAEGLNLQYQSDCLCH